MKFVVYILAILIVGLAVGASFSFTPSAKDESSNSARREVYVDLDKLVNMHPGHLALVEMRATLTDVRAGSSGYAMISRPELRVKDAADNMHGAIDRSGLVKDVAASAMNDLYRIESDQREALRTRLQEKRKTMIEDAEAETKLKAYELENEAAKRVRLIVERYAADRLNAQIKTFALKTASDTLGVDKEVAGLKFDQAHAELNYIDNVSQAQENEINAKVKEQISALRKSAVKDIDEALMLYESAESMRISESVVAVHKQILRDLKLESGYSEVGNDASANLSRTGWPVKLPKAPAVAGDASSDVLKAIEKQASEIEMRIKDDVVRVVKKLAKEKAVKVTFFRGERRLTDETQMFKNLLRDHAWDFCEPVMTGMSGS